MKGKRIEPRATISYDRDMNKRWITTFLILIMTAMPVYANDFQEGLDAIHATDYETALEKLMPLAEHGHAAAQYNIGVMHEWGNGVPQDNSQALKWYKRSAERFHKDAQNNLGALYSKGEGTEPDFVEALKWFIISAENGSEGGQKNIHIVEKRMNYEEISQAQKLANDWMRKNRKK
ncbi:MAG: sel1 repeat family protein [Nitrospinae bacterium]|nr:sel1 repeat family protein [Nitrospinota bacterium]MBL7019238.1 sel1 repeat family protein [Nitrospinaceae bacterium]